MIVKSASASSALSACLGLVVVVSFFCLPLFFGLRQWDLHNDEAIYAYAVDRVLETNEWLTPRSIQVDGPFLEKPPLKLWLVAGLIRWGVVPHDERGLRFLDVLFGTLAFAYVYAIGRRLAGTLCGIAAVLVLFTLDRFVFDHSLRSNNMEAALLLAYCGGIYHFARWEELGQDRRGWRHALAVSAYFVLGFMTKFVAVLFLPLVCAAAFAWRSDAGARLRSTWPAWVVSSLAAAVLIAPWFIYETVVFGKQFWEVILGEHIYTRFTASLDPNHLHPWRYYYVETWKELSNEGSQWIATAGLLTLGTIAVSRAVWQVRLIFLWWALPFALLAVGTSKLFHYAYPFLPPIAIGAGYVSALVVRWIADTLQTFFRQHSSRFARLATIQRRAAVLPIARRALMAGAVLAFGVAIATIVTGDLVWMANGTRLFRNSSVVRPIIIGAVFLWLRGSSSASAYAVAMLPLLAVLPVYDYHRTLEHITMVHHPLRALRDCVRDVQDSSADAGDGVYNAARARTYHSYYYYLHELGPWVEADRPERGELQRRLAERGKQTPILLSAQDYRTAVLRPESTGVPGAPDGAHNAPRDAPQDFTIFSIAAEENVVILLPGPYNVCAEKGVAAGGDVINSTTMPDVFR